MAVNPSKFLEFLPQSSETLGASIEIRNTAESLIVYKVKTTSPDMFHVHQHTGFIQQNQSKTIRVSVSAGHFINKEKFQILSTKVKQADKSAKESFRDGEIYQEIRLYCSA